MKCSCSLIFQYTSEKQAVYIQQSLAVDDDGFIESKVEDDQLHAHIKSDTISSLLHTLDDYLACIQVAENILKKQTKKKE